MSFIGTMGVVAQQGNQTVSSAPTSVSIATSNSGDHNNAIASGEANCNNESMTLDGSEFSSNEADRDVVLGTNAGAWSNYYEGCANSANISYQGYIRATGATSFAWNLTLIALQTNLSNGTSASIKGTASTDQDEQTASIGEYLEIAFGGGRGGLTFPAPGDEIVVEIDASATNSAGTTNASTLTINYNFVES